MPVSINANDFIKNRMIQMGYPHYLEEIINVEVKADTILNYLALNSFWFLVKVFPISYQPTVQSDINAHNKIGFFNEYVVRDTDYIEMHTGNIEITPCTVEAGSVSGYLTFIKATPIQ